MDLNTILSSVSRGDTAVYETAVRHWDSLAKPLGSLGGLEAAVAKTAALTGSEDVRLDRRTLVIFCADNGVVAQGVSQSDASVTEAVAHALGEGRSTINYMLHGMDCDVIPVDVGMSSMRTPQGVLDRRVRSGTADMTLEPAMTREECLHALEIGYDLACRAKTAGADLLLAGEMGIGNTTTSTAVLSILLDRSPEELTGRGAGLSDDGMKRKIRAIHRAVRVNRPRADDPVDVLAKVGGLDLAALCGFYLGAAACRRPVLLDGLITCAAALCAVRLCPAVTDALIASHCSAEPAAVTALCAMGLTPLISAGLCLGEGSGAAAALPLLDMALRVYHSGNTFDILGIEAYQHM